MREGALQFQAFGTWCVIKYASLFSSSIYKKRERICSSFFLPQTDMSDFVIRSIIILRYNVFSQLLQQLCIGTSSIWQASHTQTQHTHTPSYTYIKMSGAPLTMSDSVLFAGGCWVSLLQLWYPVRTGNYSSWQDISQGSHQTPGHWDSLIFFKTHACQRKCLEEHNILYSGICDTPRTSF